MASDSLRMTVRNVAPLVDAGPDQQATVGMVLDFAGSFADPGLLDTHTVQWDFGDGNTASGALALLVTLWLLRR